MFILIFIFTFIFFHAFIASLKIFDLQNFKKNQCEQDDNLFLFSLSSSFSFGACFPFFHFRSWILIEIPSTVSVQLTKPTKISGNVFYTDYRTSGEIPRKSTYFRFLKILEENSSNSTNLISQIFLFSGFLVNSYFRENGKYSTRCQNSPKKSVHSGIH